MAMSAWAVALIVMAVPCRASSNQCMDWSEVLQMGWKCGGHVNSDCACPPGSKKKSCSLGRKTYYSCDALTSWEQCMPWSDVEAKGWTCGGILNGQCTCPQGQIQGSCESSGKSLYACHESQHDKPVHVTGRGKAKTAGCTCAEKCRVTESNPWCNVEAECGGYTWDYCEAGGPSPGPAPGPVPGPSPPAGGAGQFIADFVKSQEGKKVYSKMQSTASCWDLAMTAIEKAVQAGYKVSHAGKTTGHWYVWSDHVVHPKDSLPGDIVQFKGWEEQTGYSFVMAADPHTAVVVEPFKADAGNPHCGAVVTMDQNPDPVHKTEYHPCAKKSGKMKVYRLYEVDGSRLFSDDIPQTLSNSASPANFVGPYVAGLLAALALASGATFVARRRNVYVSLMGDVQTDSERSAA